MARQGRKKSGKKGTRRSSGPELSPLEASEYHREHEGDPLKGSQLSRMYSAAFREVELDGDPMGTCVLRQVRGGARVRLLELVRDYSVEVIGPQLYREALALWRPSLTDAFSDLFTELVHVVYNSASVAASREEVIETLSPYRGYCRVTEENHDLVYDAKEDAREFTEEERERAEILTQGYQTGWSYAYWRHCGCRVYRPDREVVEYFKDRPPLAENPRLPFPSIYVWVGRSGFIVSQRRDGTGPLVLSDGRSGRMQVWTLDFTDADEMYELAISSEDFSQDVRALAGVLQSMAMLRVVERTPRRKRKRRVRGGGSPTKLRHRTVHINPETRERIERLYRERSVVVDGETRERKSPQYQVQVRRHDRPYWVLEENLRGRPSTGTRVNKKGTTLHKVWNSVESFTYGPDVKRPERVQVTRVRGVDE